MTTVRKQVSIQGHHNLYQIILVVVRTILTFVSVVAASIYTVVPNGLVVDSVTQFSNM